MVLMRSAASALLAVLFCASAAAQTSAPEMRRFTPQQLRGDLDVIWNATIQGDPAFDRYRSRQQLERIFARARAQLNRPMNDLEFYRIAAPAVAALGNGHAVFSLSQARSDWLDRTAPLLPAGIRVLSGKMFVLHDLSEAQVLPVGAEIISINGVAARSLLRDTVRAMVLDGVSIAPRENAAGGWQMLYDLVRLHDMGPSYTLVLRDRRGQRSVTVAGRRVSELVRVWRERFPRDPEVAERAPASLTFETGLAVMRIPHWDAPVEGRPGLSEHFSAWFAQLAQANTPALVIDIRGNGGGAEVLATELLSYLSDRPFRYYTCLSMNAADFDFFRYAADAAELRAEIPNYVRPASPECRRFGALELTEAAFSNLGVQQPRQPHYRGRVYLLVDSGSFSTSSEFASAFASRHIGTIVGHETSGGYLGDSSGIEALLRLPATGMTFNATMIAYHMAVPRHGGEQGGVRPDIDVRRRIEDLVAARDMEMEAVRAEERRRR